MNRTSHGHTAFWARAALWGLIYAFILSFLHLELIVKDTPPTGGDTAGHYQTLLYLLEHLLPHGRLVGWMPGNYAGFPLFQMYFPLPFLIMAGLSLALPAAVAFKAVSVLGILALPAAAWYMLRSMDFKDQVPECGALFSLVFLFMESNSAWGGNILSTLAGEFTYSLSLALSLICLGRLAADIDDRRRAGTNAVLLSLVGLTHGYPLLFVVAGSSFFLLTTRDWLSRFIYLLRVNLLAFCLMGFWIVPLLLYSPYTTPFNFVWIIDSWTVVLPAILWPPAVFGLMALASAVGRTAGRHDRRIWFFVFLIGEALALYLIAFKLGVVDVRFLPFAQVFAVVLGAVGAGWFIRQLRARSLAVVALTLITLAWTGHFVIQTGSWAEWNFSGWTNKPLWPALQEIAEYLKGDYADPRVAYEHAPQTEQTGTVRAFENLPQFSGRATLEGLYIQASLSAPFVFYLQSELSPAISAPLTGYNYARFDPAAARRHLKLFNVGQYVTATAQAREAAEKAPGFTLEKTSGPFAVFRVTENDGWYVSQPEFQPVLALSDDPKRDSFAWFRRGDVSVPLALDRPGALVDGDLFARVLTASDLPQGLTELPRQPLPPGGDFSETVRPGEITVKGCAPGRPLLVKVSYHPGWRVEGARRVWRAAPSFMMVFPEGDEITLRFGWAWPDWLGAGLSVLAVLLLAGRLLGLPDSSGLGARLLEPAAVLIRPRAGTVLTAVLTLAALSLAYVILAVSYQDPSVYYLRGLKLFDSGKYEEARKVFSQAASRFPLSPVVDQTLHHLALSYFRQDHFEAALSVWGPVRRRIPGKPTAARSLVSYGLVLPHVGAAGSGPTGLGTHYGRISGRGLGR